MKVNVLTINDLAISKWRWWSDWVDVSVFDYAGYGFLLQMKVNRRNSKKFKAIALKSSYNSAHASTSQAGDLLQMASDK